MEFPSPPRGLKAIPWRLPICLYRSGLGWMLGKRFLLLRHVGRKSGKIRFAVLEIIHNLPEPERYYAVSGFGTRSNWYQNILQRNDVEIQVGNKRIPVHSKQLDPPEGSEMLFAYAQNNPRSLQALSNLMGYEIEFTPQGIREFGRNIPVIQFSAAASIKKE